MRIFSSQKWTPLDEIARVAVDYLNGDHDEFDIKVIVRTEDSWPLWLTHLDENGLEVMTPWTSIKDMTILERHIEKESS